MDCVTIIVRLFAGHGVDGGVGSVLQRGDGMKHGSICISFSMHPVTKPPPATWRSGQWMGVRNP